MPTILDANKEKDELEKQGEASQAQAGEQQGAVQATSGATSQAGTSSTQAPQAAGAAQGGSFAGREGSRSGSFTNLQNYMRGNVKGSAQTTGRITGQAEQLANTADTNIAGEAGRVDTELTDIRTQAQKEQDEGRQALQSIGGIDKQSDDFTTQFQSQQKELQEAVDTRGQSQSRLEALQLQGQQERAQQAQEAEEYANQITSESGRAAALKRLADRPTYTRGQSALDTALTGTGENLQRIQQTSQDVQAKQLSQRNQELEASIQGRKADIMSAVEQGLVGSEEAEGLLTMIDREAQNMRAGLENQATALRDEVRLAAEQNRIVGDENEAIKQALGNKLVYDRQGNPLVRMGNVAGQDIMISLDKYKEQMNAPGEMGNKYFDTVGQVPENFNLANVDPRTAAMYNSLARMSGIPEEQLAQNLINVDGQELGLDNLDNVQAKQASDFLNYQNTLSNVENVLTPEQQADFQTIGKIGGDAGLANHNDTHINAAASGWIRDDNAANAMRSMLTPQQRAEFDAVLQQERDNAATKGQFMPKRFRRFTQMAQSNTSRRDAINQALQNTYGQGISYQDLVNNLSAAPGDGKASIF